MKNRSYIIVFTALLAIALGTYQLIIPKFSTKAYSRETVENISQGITTSTVDSAGNQEGVVGEDNTSNTNENEETEISIKVGVEQELLRFNNAEKLENTFTSYLLIGSDKRSKESSPARGYVQGQRADVLILGIVNDTSDNTSLISIPRDLLIRNSCTDEIQRINASFISNACGNDVENLAASILNLTGITVDHLALFNFEGFEKIIDSVGGIELCVDRTVREGFSFELQKGCQIVTGEIALNWVVSRNTEVLLGNKIVDENGNDASTWKKLSDVTDLTRIDRQQDVVIELLSQVNNFESLNELTNFISALEDTFIIDENLTNNKAATILWSLRSQSLGDINKLTIPTRPYRTESGMEVLVMTSYFYDFLEENNLLD